MFLWIPTNINKLIKLNVCQNINNSDNGETSSQMDEQQMKLIIKAVKTRNFIVSVIYSDDSDVDLLTKKYLGF